MQFKFFTCRLNPIYIIQWNVSSDSSYSTSKARIGAVNKNWSKPPNRSFLTKKTSKFRCTSNGWKNISTRDFSRCLNAKYDIILLLSYNTCITKSVQSVLATCCPRDSYLRFPTHLRVPSFRSATQILSHSTPSSIFHC
jgi:hypothetical protein